LNVWAWPWVLVLANAKFSFYPCSNFFSFHIENIFASSGLEDTLSFLAICMFLGWIVVVTNCCIDSLKLFCSMVQIEMQVDLVVSGSSVQ
jgi:hypothetical protein